MNKKVSVITPTFNRAKYLPDVIKSLKNQTYPHWELIIVDDGSTDDSEAIVNSYVKNDDRIVFLKRRGKLKGAATCRNTGIEYAHGDFLIFVDSDDYLASFALAQRIKVMEANPQLDFAVFPGLRFTHTPGDNNYMVNRVFENKTALDAFLEQENPWQTSAPVWRANTLSEHQLKWNESLQIFQDIDFHIKALVHKMNFQIIENVAPDYFWRDHAEGKITDYSTYVRHLNSCISFLVGVIHLLDEHKMMGEKQRGNLANYFFSIARILSQAKELKKSLTVWQYTLTHHLISRRKYRAGRAYLIAFFIIYQPWMRHAAVKDFVKKLYGWFIPPNLDKLVELEKYEKEIKV